MFYWLFTEGKTVFSGWLGPLTCFSLLTPVTVAVLLGVGIQRRVDGTPLKTTGLLSIRRLLSFVVPSLGLIALYPNLLDNIAIVRPTERQAPLKGAAAWLVGGPAALLIMAVKSYQSPNTSSTTDCGQNEFTEPWFGGQLSMISLPRIRFSSSTAVLPIARILEIFSVERTPLYAICMRFFLKVAW